MVVEELMLKETKLDQEIMDIQKEMKQLQFLIAMLKENIQWLQILVMLKDLEIDD